MNKITFTEEKMNTNTINSESFENAKNCALGLGKGMRGIGTLSEKAVHATLKYYYAPNQECHELRIDDYVADAIVDGEIYEIQSKNFYSMRNKLESFLKKKDVTIIYPIPIKKYLRYVDPETGEISESRLSNKRMGIYDIIPELYSIKDIIANKKLHFVICFINMEEYKFLNGYGKSKKIRASKIDRIPLSIQGEFYINKKKDLLNLLPGIENWKRTKDCPLPKEFTNKDIARLTGFNISYAQMLTNILCYHKLIKNVGSQGRYKLYSF